MDLWLKSWLSHSVDMWPQANNLIFFALVQAVINLPKKQDLSEKHYPLTSACMSKCISKTSGWMMQQILFQLSTPRNQAVAHITFTLQHNREFLWHITVALFNYSTKLIAHILTLVLHLEIMVSKEYYCRLTCEGYCNLLY